MILLNTPFHLIPASVAPRMGFLANWVIVPILRPVLLGMFDMEKFLKEKCSDINYTVVRPPGLGSAPKTGVIFFSSSFLCLFFFFFY